MAGISNPYLSQIERGLRKPSAEILQQIARALEISSETLYVRAGILEERDGRRPGRGDPPRPDLSEEQKKTLIRIYPRSGTRTGARTAEAEPSTSSVNPTRWAWRAPTLRAPPRRPLPPHVPLAQPGMGDSGGMNVYVRELVAVAGPGRRRLHDVYVRRWAPTCPRSWSTSSPASGWCTSTPAPRPGQGGSCPTSSTSSPTACSPTSPTTRRRRARQLLAVGRGRPPAQARARPAARVTFHTLARVKAETGDPEPERRVGPRPR
jgi:transcriptional regulator with XRE-family HTH domain